MKNLKLYYEASLNLPLQSDDEVIQFSAIDIERHRLFFASSANLIYTCQLSSFLSEGAWKEDGTLSVQLDTICLEPGDVITAFDYLMEKESLIVGTGNGLLLLHNVDESTSELVGSVEGGVRCISPSPDGDLLGVVTGFGRVLVMTPDWELMYETTIEDVPDGVDDSDITPSSSFSSPMSWRGDGKYFATVSEQPNSPSHKRIKVWERDTGLLHSTSESKEIMGALLDWMPSGAKIAAVYDRKDKNECPSIAFYERNGLERSSFSINEVVGATVETLKWNCTSDILATVVRSEEYDLVKIWYFSNNHWYLKHEIRYLRQDGVRIMWDPTKSQQLLCWTLGGQITIYNFVWVSAVTENSTALVVDGSRILVTPLALSLMPPPMYLFSLRFPKAVRDFSFYSKNSKNCLAAVLSDGCLGVVELPAPNTWEELEGKEFIVEASSLGVTLGSFLHLIWLDSHILLGVCHFGFSHSNNSSDGAFSKDKFHGFYLQEIELVCSEDHVPNLVTCSGWHAKVSRQNFLERPVIGVASNPINKCSAFVQFVGGRIYEYLPKLGLVGESPKDGDASFSSSCPWMSVVPISTNGQLKPLLLGLDDIGRLQAGTRMLCNNCSSFSFYSDLTGQGFTHMILTTKQDLLFIVDISEISGESELKYDNFIHTGNHKREESTNFITIWERGAKIVGVLHGDESAVILQTTRGNLECKYPRKLVIASIVNALLQHRFKDALLMVRRHRIDYNIIVDYPGWQAFLQSASKFIRQVKNLSYLTDFICSITNENITQTLYKSYVSLPYLKDTKTDEVRNLKGPDGRSKVSSVLMALRKSMEEQLPESPARELCILTTLARSDPPALEEALKRIKIIREMELMGSNDPRRVSYPSAEEAVKHLLWLSNPEAVFDAALGIYDLNLAAMVALNSQRDPKEFLPFLQELEHMPDLFMQYNIDLRLGRYENALKHIVSAGEEHYADTMSLIKGNPQLFPLGLKLITDPGKRKQVFEAWGDHLVEEKCYEDAATTYLCCSCLDKALKAYRACGNWSGVLTVAGFLKIGKDEIMQLAHDLCEELEALGKPGEAAKIALEYCGDVSHGVNLFMSARDWEEALRVAFMHRRDDLIAEVESTSKECAGTLIDEYQEGLEKVGKYLARYLAVRQRRLLLAAKIQSEEQSMTDRDDDTISEASSNFSGMSAYTTGSRKGSAASISSSTTSKARGRQRNKGKIRPGSAGEEMALVEHLKGMALTDGAKRELRSLLIALAMLCKEEIARKLQHTAENFHLSQMAAVRLAEDTISSNIIDEHAHTLNEYVPIIKCETKDSETFFWRSKVFASS